MQVTTSKNRGMQALVPGCIQSAYRILQAGKHPYL